MTEWKYPTGALLISYSFGIIAIGLGILQLRKLIKENSPVFDDSIFQPTFRGWLAGIGLIVLGLFIIGFKFSKQV